MKFCGKITAILLAVLLAVSTVQVAAGTTHSGEQSSERRTAVSSDRWYDADAFQNAQTVTNWTAPVQLKTGESLTVDFTTESGTKRWLFRYRPIDPSVSECLVKLSVDGTEQMGALPLLWTDAKEKYEKDSYGNELYPKQQCLSEYIVNPLVNYGSAVKSDFVTDFTAGTHKATITADSQTLLIEKIALSEPEEAVSYVNYRKKHKGGLQGDGLYVAEAEKYAVKSDSYIRSDAVKKPDLVPYAVHSKKINILSGDTWDTVGQQVAWEINVKKAGLYRIALKYQLENNAGKVSYRSLRIDGELPFAECNSLPFAGTGRGYQNYTLSDASGENYEFYLTEGTHLLSFRVEIGDFEPIYQDIKMQMEQINSIGSLLQKLTAGTVDENRTWDMDNYMPGTVDTLREYAKNIRSIYEKLKKLSDGKASFASNILYAAESIEKLIAKPDQIPNRTNLLSAGDSSAAKYLGVVLNELTVFPLSVDRLYVYGDTSLPDASVSVFKRVTDSVRSFIYSFLPSAKNGDYSASYKKSDELKVWINRPIQYVQVLQQILDEDYNARNKTNIRLSVMPSEQKLILANASGNNPDVVLSAAYSTPYNLAIRGAAKNLLDYPDFLSAYAKDYNLESLIPLCYNNGIYGAIESQDFAVLFYRKDTLEALGLTVPDTWDDVERMMPELLRYSMNFCIPIASAGGTKSFGVTAPFLYQNQGTVYQDGGLAVDYGSKNSAKGFMQMTELFNIYGCSQTVANFYNSFRYNTTPIGISNFSTYMQLSVAAPELAGLWSIAPVPGVKQEDGTVLRYQMADSTSAMIFKNTKKENEAWQFMKWWLSSDVQLNYANSLQTTYGPEYRLNTANLNAFSKLQYNAHDKAVILKQWEFQKENVQHPAGYMSERELSNAWINVVVNSEGTADALDQAILRSNREIIRKMQEFGFCDVKGNVTEQYKQLTAEDLYRLLSNERGEE